MLLAENRNELALLFYDNLFDMAPHLRRLFQSNLQEQRDKIVAMLDHAVNSLTRFDTIKDDVYQLGVRHAEYGIDEDHFEVAATALLKTFRDVLGKGFTESMADAWAEAYWILAAVMKRGMRYN